MSLGNADPWHVRNPEIKEGSTEPTDKTDSFEDNFTPGKDSPTPAKDAESPTGHEPLPDSSDYLKLLERKLARVQKGNKLLDNLRDKRQDCMRGLLESEGVPISIFEQFLELDTPIESGRLHRHLLPVQAVNVGETVYIVDHDALQRSEEEEEAQSAAEH
ncbi:uncharacterized protein [Drosophila kikkawai]|uniref:Uncharacterized protein n=1 Tax=Drosophila kikkawai TaxID=30033 RepID=A0A6P4IEJ1_DROKI|nr:uncharacterized protein LOC108077742 [Drosophila kikkawai]